MTRSPVNTLVAIVFVVIFSPNLSRAGTPAIFIFGDSLFDVGTNNYVLRTLAKANFPYYGIDFFNSTPNGRFCNGQGLADFTAKVAFGETVTSPPPFNALFNPGNSFNERLVKAMDFDPMGPWESPMKDFSFASIGTKENPAKGINFASSAASILDKTSAIAQAVSMTQQLNQLMFIRGNLTATIGPWKTHLLFAKSTYFICIGNNDVNFVSMARTKLDPDAYVEDLIDHYNRTLRVLYNLGARKFGIFGIPYVGCTPLVRVTIPAGNCSKMANDLAQDLNSRLEKLLYVMRIHSRGMIYSFADSYNLLYDILENKERYNLKNVNDACCGLGRFNAMTNCNPAAKLCKNRDEYLFWDTAHPTQYASGILIGSFAFGGPRYVRPINWSKLVSL